MDNIRKISVGSGYPNGAIHYQVGQRKNILQGEYIISEIVFSYDVKSEKYGYSVFIKNEDDNSTVLWKRIVDMPVVIENDVNFE